MVRAESLIVLARFLVPALAVVVFAAVAALRFVAVALAVVLPALDAHILACHVLLVLGVAVARVLPAPHAVGAQGGLVCTEAVLDAEVARRVDARVVGCADLARPALGAGARLLALLAARARAAQQLLLTTIGGLVAVLTDQRKSVELLLRLRSCGRRQGLGKKDGRKEGTHLGGGWMMLFVLLHQQAIKNDLNTFQFFSNPRCGLEKDGGKF